MRVLELIQGAVGEGRLQEAVALALEHAPRDENARFLLPALYLASRDRRQCLHWIRTLAAELEGEWNVLPLCRLAALSRQAGAIGLARRCLERAIVVGPDRWPPRWERYRLARDCGALTSAAQELKSLGALRGDSARFFHEVAYLAGESGALEKALDAYARAGDAFAHHQRAEIFRRLGDVAAARSEQERALALDSGYLWTRWRRAEDWAAAGEFGRARDELACVRDESQPLLSQLRAEWLERDGRTSEADQVRLSLVSERLRGHYAGRLRFLRDEQAEWHAFGGREDLSRCEVTVADLGVPGAAEVLPQALHRFESFHRRVLPGAELTLRRCRRSMRCSYDDLEESVMYGNRLWLCRRLRLPTPDEDQCVLVTVGGRAPWRATRGYGGAGLAVVEVEPEDRWTATVMVHEFYHAVFGLQHSDGTRFAWDPFGIMGYPGASVDLRMAYVDFRQRCHLSSPPGIAHLAEEAWEAEKRGRWAQAEQSLREAHRRDPLHLWAITALARVCLCAGRSQEAVEWLERAQEMDPSFELSSWRVRLHLELARHAEAEALACGTAGYDRSALAHLALGRARAETLDQEGALFDIHRARGLEPASWEPLFHLATVRHRAGAYRSAEKLYRRCLKAYPRWGPVLRRLAMVLARQGRYPEARAELERGRWLEGRSCEQAFAEATVQWAEGLWEEALRSYRRAHGYQRQAQSPLLALGYVCASLGRDVAAARWFRRCAERNPVSLVGRMARLYLNSGSVAESEARALLRRDPANNYVLFWLLRNSRRASDRQRWRLRLRRQEPNHPWWASAEEFPLRTENDVRNREGPPAAR